MDNFSKEYNGYNKTEVDMTIEKMKKEFEQKLKEQNFSKDNELENLQNRVFEQEKQNERLQDEQKKLQDIIIDCMNRQEKAENIIKSTQNLKELEQKRLELLYKKWEEFSRVLDDKVLSYGLNSDLQKLADDFEYALKIVVDGKGQNDGDKSYAKSVLTRMSGSNNDSNKIIKKYVAKSSVKKYDNVEEHILEEEVTVSQIESEAEKFLNGKSSSIPKSLGVGKEVFSIPQKQKEEPKQGFSLEEALTPKESLEEIMSVFNLDD